MKAILFYRPNSEHATTVESYLRDFTARTGKQLPTVDVDSREGIEQCRLYEVVRYPTIVAIDSQGQELQRWDGEMLPQISEISYYLQDI
jgi:hypothetical protein